MSNFKKHFGQNNSRNEINVGPESKSRFHCSLPNSYKAHLEEVQHHSMACLQAMKNLCQSANDMAEGFTTLFQDTPFCEVATNLQHISQELASTTGEVCQHVNENVSLQTSRLINRGLKEKTDESIQVMAHCFLLMLQTQCQFFNSASQIFEPLVRFQSLEDFFVGDDRDEILKEACASWLRMSQMTKTLRRGDTVPIGDLVNLNKSQNASDPKIAEIKQRLDALILTYKYEFVLLPKTDFTIIGGFHQHPQCSALVLKGCCHDNQIQSLLSQSQSMLEEMLRYMPKSQSEMPNQEELASRLKANLQDVTIQVEGEVCKQTSSKEENFYKIMDLISNLVSKTMKQNGLTLDVRLLAFRLLSEMCPQSTHTQSQIAAHILFGRSNLVSIEQVPIENGFHNYVQVSSHGPLLIIEVPTVWSLSLIVPGQTHHAVTGGKSILGKMEVVYTIKFDVIKWSDGRKQQLPIIQVKLCKELEDNVQHVVTRQNQHPCSQPAQESPISNLRKKFGKLNSKFNKKVSSGSNKNVKDVNKEGLEIQTQNEKPALTVPNAEQQQDGQLKVLVSPLVTITSSDNSDTSSSTPWSDESVDKTKGFATDVEVQNIVDLLSGGQKPAAPQQPKAHPETLIVIANPDNQERHNPGWGTTQQAKTVPTYGNFNPHYQEDDYSDKRWANSGIYPSQPSKINKGVEHTGEQVEFAQYLAKNFFKKHGFTDEGHALSLASQWSSSEGKMNRTWPSIDPPGDGSDVINHSWPMGHDSGSSSDGEESASGDTYSMGLGLSGPGLMASVNRRRHSSGGEESLHIPGVFNAMVEPPALKYPTALLDIEIDPKSVRTWPPKNVWQRPSSPQPPNNNQYIVNQQEQLDVHRPLQAQWSDPLSVRHSNVWGPATGSTPVSPASSFTSLNAPQPHGGQRPKSTSPRPHPRLDRKYAYNVHQFQSR